MEEKRGTDPGAETLEEGMIEGETGAGVGKSLAGNFHKCGFSYSPQLLQIQGQEAPQPLIPLYVT